MTWTLRWVLGWRGEGEVVAMGRSGREMTELDFAFEREMDLVADEALCLYEAANVAYAEGDLATAQTLGSRSDNCSIALYHARQRGYWI